MRRPNLLLILCDELRWSEVGCYGHRVVRTPTMDRLAGEGVRMETAVTNAPVCLPARTVTLSGQYARTSLGAVGNTALQFRRSSDGSTGWLFDAYAPPTRTAFPDATLPELLRDAGYHTRAVGKWHVDAWPHQVGFDDYLIPRTHHAHTAQLFTENGGPEFAAPGFSVDYEAGRVCDFLADSGEKPWFLYYNISPPHMPLADMPERYLTMYDAASVELRPNVPQPFDDAAHADTYRTYLWDYRHYLAHLPHAEVLPEGLTLAGLTALYYGATTWVDDTLARVLAALEASGQADDTLVVFTSDHGDMLGSHDLFGKSTLHEESCRVPMIARGPGITAGCTASDGVASLVDLAPTLLDAASVDRPTHLQGTSLMPMFRGEEAGPSAAFVESQVDGLGVRTTGQMHVAQRGATWDLRADPHQVNPPTPDDGFADRVADWERRTPWMEVGRR